MKSFVLLCVFASLLALPAIASAEDFDACKSRFYVDEKATSISPKDAMQCLGADPNNKNDQEMWRTIRAPSYPNSVNREQFQKAERDIFTYKTRQGGGAA